MDDDVRVTDFLQSALKRVDQMMGELSDKTDRIGQQNFLFSGRLSTRVVVSSVENSFASSRIPAFVR